MYNILDRIDNENDIKNIDKDSYKKLSKEIRRFLINKISTTGGHLASNLGVVELTMALHLCLDLPEDKIIWDVGHQAYTHKILTGRKNIFHTLRSYEGISGFPKTKESSCDAFDTGHSSTSISLALGFAKARDLQNKNNTIVAVIGDGALSGGMAYEALNNAARLKSNLIIILNDNEMSISKNVGGMSNYLGKMRTGNAYIGIKSAIEKAVSSIPGVGADMVKKIKKSKDSLKHFLVPGMLFEEMGITYIGPMDGHNIEQLTAVIQNAKRMKKAVLIHVITKKGKGYSPAEKDPARFHGVEPFDLKTGKNITSLEHKTYTDIFADKLLEIAENNEKVVAISAAMTSGIGLEEFGKRFPERFFDVGIAEEHAVTFGAGMAIEGLKPIVAIYSSFFQRAYDQIIHDVCIQSLPVVLAIDRAGIIGRDGETHQGVFDISFLSSMPNMTIAAPKNAWELEQLLEYSIEFQGPIAIRYPRGEAYLGLGEYKAPIIHGKSEVIYKEKDIVLLAVGSMVKVAEDVRHILKEKGCPNISLVNVRFVKPFDKELIEELVTNHSYFITMEENVLQGGFSQSIAGYLYEIGQNHVKLKTITVPDIFVEHGDVNTIKDKLDLTPKKIANKILGDRL